MGWSPSAHTSPWQHPPLFPGPHGSLTWQEAPPLARARHCSSARHVDQSPWMFPFSASGHSCRVMDRRMDRYGCSPSRDADTHPVRNSADQTTWFDPFTGRGYACTGIEVPMSGIEVPAPTDARARRSSRKREWVGGLFSFGRRGRACGARVPGSRERGPQRARAGLQHFRRDAVVSRGR
jgi:hypothetical protein